MEEEKSSWVRRAKFSQTVCHRWDSSKFLSIPFSLHHDDFPVLKPTTSNAGLTVQPSLRGIVRETQVGLARQRSKSPIPETVLSEAFMEARSESKRFSTPCQRRREPDRPNIGRLFHGHGRDSHSTDYLSSSSVASSPRKKFSSLKAYEETKGKKESSWAKYFDPAGGKVSAVDTMEEWTVDLSKLFLGLRFASGAHSKLYHGIYKDQAVAVKMIRVPDNDENGDMAARLEKQFTREVTILSHLYHHNVIKVMIRGLGIVVNVY